ncbi:hypothetical protein [Rhizobium leguminosarum]|uniref:hypothetical protein n=1 Tax=Rhizobium leguminosarum TaxID=384 RepID=UPI001C95A936|nr:hypothetical protein [Rhizobium leguminosarum]MBY5403445.1 hypothetical protein [Rhizobium leguminosarum]
MKTHQQRIEARRLVFLDEAWIKTNMAPGWGLGPTPMCGGPARALENPDLHCRLTLRPHRCPLVHRCSDGEPFTLYFERILVPTHAKGDIVILDNLGSHKGQAVNVSSGQQART